jgi:quinol monooxygenase YgiN
MIIMSGRIRLRPGARDQFLAQSRDAIERARRTPGCLDFVVAADPLDPDRANVYEEWESEAALLAFRGDGPGPALGSLIAGAQVRRHVVASSGPA